MFYDNTADSLAYLTLRLATRSRALILCTLLHAAVLNLGLPRSLERRSYLRRLVRPGKKYDRLVTARTVSPLLALPFASRAYIRIHGVALWRNAFLFIDLP